MKDAKQSSIHQVADIQQLFAAIDEISEQARQTRLSLERQINVRKLEIKRQCIQSGIDRVQEFLHQQDADLQFIDHSEYINRYRFESLIKGKASIKGIQSVIDDVCESIITEISQRAVEVKTNGQLLDTLPNQYRLLFQDRQTLLALSHQELQLTIEKRIALLNEENARGQAEQARSELRKVELIGLNSDPNGLSEKADVVEKQKYRLIIEILSSKDTAIEIARYIREVYSNNASVFNIRLSRNCE